MLDEELAAAPHTIGTAALIGLPIFAFEAFFVSSPLSAGFRRWPLSRFVAARCSVWLAWIFVATQLSHRWFWSTEEAPWVGNDKWWTIAFSLTVSLAVVSALALNRLIGPGVFRQLLLGRYHSPTEERRALLFIDLADSTAIAGRQLLRSGNDLQFPFGRISASATNGVKLH